VKQTTHHFAGYALTPVHVGDGTTMTPDGYRLRPGPPAVLERFDPPAVIAAMPPSLRTEYIKALSQGGLKQAQTILGKAADGAIRDRLSISQNSREEIEQVMGNPLRGGRISPFVRCGGMPIVPGSSVKGTLRTAWLAAKAPSILRDEVQALSGTIERMEPGKTGRQSDKLQRTVFDCEQSHTEQDPLRDISVSDAPLEPDSTVIDRVHVANCTKEGPIAVGPEGRMQIHVERLASIADGDAFPLKPFKIAIAAFDDASLAERLDRAGVRAKGGTNVARAVPTHSPRLDELRRATNAFHTALWFYERHRFYQGTGTDRLMDELLSAFGFPLHREGLESALESAGIWLLKVGRYSHFESKSVEFEGNRYGSKAARRGRPAEFMSQGGSRTVARDAVGRFLPFGWVLLFPEATAPKAVPRFSPRPQTHERPLRRGAPPTTARTSGSAHLLFRKGERVTDGEEEATVFSDVRFADKRMEVEYDDGEVLPVPVERWRKIP
jgi:hypothetical protein